MRFRVAAGAVAVSFAMMSAGCMESRKPNPTPMATDGPNQYVYSVPGMT
jgi:hypothetical protein